MSDVSDSDLSLDPKFCLGRKIILLLTLGPKKVRKDFAESRNRKRKDRRCPINIYYLRYFRAQNEGEGFFCELQKQRFSESLARV